MKKESSDARREALRKIMRQSLMRPKKEEAEDAEPEEKKPEGGERSVTVKVSY